MCMEFCRWFDHWGLKEHSVADYAEHKKSLEEMLERGHVNFLICSMEEQTSDLWNGSNYDDKVG